MISYNNRVNLSRGVVHVRCHNGHRGAYQSLFINTMGLVPSSGRAWKNFARLTMAPYVLFATLDGEEVSFSFIALLRSALGKPTAALFLRPQGCFGSTVRHLSKLAVFTFLRRLPNLRVLTILPFEVEPNFAKVARDWIYDPQLWDLIPTGQIDKTAETSLSEQVRRISKGRPIVAFMGTVSKRKGFHLLAQSISVTPNWSADMCVVVAGKVEPACQELAHKMKEDGAVVIDRYVTDSELSSLYVAASCVWCCYDFNYDQASGIFGRALQFGRTPVVRAGSKLEQLAQVLGIPYEQIIVMKPGDSLVRLRERVTDTIDCEKLMNLSISKLRWYSQ